MNIYLLPNDLCVTHPTARILDAICKYYLQNWLNRCQIEIYVGIHHDKVLNDMLEPMKTK
jgi:hypothetical protein